MIRLIENVRLLMHGTPRWFHSLEPYNKYMNAVHKSDQVLAFNNANRKRMTWWKSLSFFSFHRHTVVTTFLLFKEHQTKFPNRVDLHRPGHFSLSDFREEIVRQLCNLPECDEPPVLKSVKPAPPARVNLRLSISHISLVNIAVCFVYVTYSADTGQYHMLTRVE